MNRLFLLDEGGLSEPLEIFKQKGLYPNIQYHVHNDYTIMSMVENGLGISIFTRDGTKEGELSACRKTN
ncbi:hypothetical protein GCM10020331_101900 [Ectobacillus funiculus]